jgi:hypothetical protein
MNELDLEKIKEWLETSNHYKWDDVEDTVNYLIAGIERLREENEKLQRVAECAREIDWDMVEQAILGYLDWSRTGNQTVWLVFWQQFNNLQQALADYKEGK